MAERTRTRGPDAHAVSGRAAAYWGWAFLVLLLVSAGMVTVPGGDDDVAFVREFYTDHRTVIVIAQVIGLAAAAAFLPFARGLQGQSWVGRRPWVFVSGVSVAGAGVLAGAPPLALCVVADSGDDGTISALATASDLVDVVLFLTIAGLGAVVLAAVEITWLRVLSALVLAVCGIHALLRLRGETPLELVAPLAFLTLVGCLAVLCRRRGDRSGSSAKHAQD
jgi:hypothetical protein